jgi:hypothetical protein
MASADSQRPWMATVNRRKSSLEASESVANKEDKKGLTDLLFQSCYIQVQQEQWLGFGNRLLMWPAWRRSATTGYITWYINSRGGGTCI